MDQRRRFPCGNSLLVFFHLFEVNPWTQTPILANIGTFVVPLSTYLPLENQIKWVFRTSSEKDAVIWNGSI